MKITSKGQVTIPQKIREKFGLWPDTEVEFVVEGSTVKIVKAKSEKREGRGEGIVRRLRGRAEVAMSTDEIMAHTRGEP
jgi:AbrB family looped-hinge helix DNA binding protein